jgi:hypothetical protein
MDPSNIFESHDHALTVGSPSTYTVRGTTTLHRLFGRFLATRLGESSKFFAAGLDTFGRTFGSKRVLWGAGSNSKLPSAKDTSVQRVCARTESNERQANGRER